MAQLKDLIVNGASRFIGDTFINKLQITSISAPTSAGGTTYDTGTDGQVLKSNGTSIYWGTDNNSGTVTKVTAGTGLKVDTASSGGDITTTGTINHINSVTAQTTQALYPIKIDAQGHISAYGTAVTSLPASDVYAWAKASTKPSYGLSEITGTDDLQAIEGLSGTSGLLRKTAADTWSLDTNDYITGMFIASYGSSTYADVLAAYQANKVVYCRASSNSNPSSGSQNRMAFLAYVNNSTTPTEFEFQYYRSVATHSESQQGDQVFVYKLNSSGTWSVTTREAYTKIAYNNGITGTYSSGTLTLKHSNTAITAQSTQAVYPITIDAYGHITGYGTSPTTLAGYGITDAKIESGVITLGSNTITPKTVQTAVTKPTATTNQWVSAIGQNTNGVIDVDYASLDTSGTWSGNAATATKLATARSLKTKLDSTTAVTFDGSADQDAIPVTGTLGAANGGTGKTSLQDAANALINALSTGSSTPADADYYVSQYVSGGTTTTTYHRRPMSALYTYIQGKADTRYVQKTGDTMSGNLKISSNATYAWFDVTNTNTGCRMLLESDSNGTHGLWSSGKYVNSTYTGTGAWLLFRSNADGEAHTNLKLYGAVWNDYAEYRKNNPNEIQEPGRCVKELGNGALALTTKRLERGCEIISDTFGFAIGQDEENGYNTPIASNGRVLAYPYESIEEFANHIGWPVCSGPNGTVSIMTEEEEEKYPSRIVGIISEIPTYDEWGTGKVKINGRIWIRVR